MIEKTNKMIDEFEARLMRSIEDIVLEYHIECFDFFDPHERELYKVMGGAGSVMMVDTDDNTTKLGEASLLDIIRYYSNNNGDHELDRSLAVAIYIWSIKHYGKRAVSRSEVDEIASAPYPNTWVLSAVEMLVDLMKSEKVKIRKIKTTHYVENFLKWYNLMGFDERTSPYTIIRESRPKVIMEEDKAVFHTPKNDKYIL